jgi:hypothetical protein
MNVGHGQVGIHLDMCHPTVVYARLVLLFGSFKNKSGEMSFGTRQYVSSALSLTRRYQSHAGIEHWTSDGNNFTLLICHLLGL